MPPVQNGARAVRNDLNESMQHHRRRDRRETGQHAHQDQAAGHPEYA
jgi:hypothetical protein